MPKIKIVYDRENCIGAGACAAIDPDNFVMNQDGKADLTNAKETKPGIWEKEQADIKNALDGARACPVKVIKIIDLEKNKELE